MRMRKFRILLLILASAACTFGALAAGPEIGTLMENARELFEKTDYRALSAPRAPATCSTTAAGAMRGMSSCVRRPP